MYFKLASIFGKKSHHSVTSLGNKETEAVHKKGTKQN